MLTEKKFQRKEGSNEFNRETWEQRIFSGVFEGMNEPVALIVTNVTGSHWTFSRAMITLQVGTNWTTTYTRKAFVESDSEATASAKKNLTLKGWLK